MIMLLKSVSPNTMQSLGWALLHFLWQGTALAALAAVAMALCRRASTRYLLGLGTLVLMMLAPVATLSFYSSSAFCRGRGRTTVSFRCALMAGF